MISSAMLNNLKGYITTQGKQDHYRFYVYAYIRVKDSNNGRSGTPYYIGKGSGDRAWVKHRHIHFTESQVVIIAWELSEVRALAIERRLIRLWGKQYDNSGCLLNITDGGDGVTGYVASPAEIAKRLATMRNNLQTKYGVQYTSYSQLPSVRKKITTTCEELYGGPSPFASEFVRAKSMATVTGKYGTNNVSQVDHIHQKKIDTFRDKYGANYYMQTPEFVNKTVIANMQRYGVANVFASEEIQKKIKADCLEKYGVEFHQSRPDVRDKISTSLKGKPKSKEHREKMQINHDRNKGMVQALDTRIGKVVKVTREEFEANNFYEGATAKPKTWIEVATGAQVLAYKRDARVSSGELVKPDKFNHRSGPGVCCLCCNREHYMAHYNRHLTNNYKKISPHKGTLV